jgi:hypothetical protein
VVLLVTSSEFSRHCYIVSRDIPPPPPGPYREKRGLRLASTRPETSSGAESHICPRRHITKKVLNCSPAPPALTKMSSHVIVISPDVKRVSVKVNPGTYMFDVLEEACKKLNLQVDKWSLK